MTNRIRPDDVNPRAHTDTSLSYTLGRLKPLPIPSLPSSTVVPVKNEGHAVLGAMEREMESRMSAQFKQMNDALQAQRIAFQLKEAGSTGPAETVQPPSPPEPEPYYGEHDPAEDPHYWKLWMMTVAYLKST